MLGCLAAGAGARATPLDDFQDAEKAFTAGDWLRAAPLYDSAAERLDVTRRSVCYERLVRIHARLGRLDRAIHYGLKCRELLLPLRAADRLPELELELGECYLLLGHLRDADRYLELALAGGNDAIAPLRRLHALFYLAKSAEKRGDAAAAGRWWVKLEKAAIAELAASREMPQQERIECTWKLADSYLAQKRPRPAITALELLLPTHDRQRDNAGKRDTFRRLAAHHRLLGDLEQSEKDLRAALDLHDTLKAADPVLHGDLADELGDIAAARGNRDAAFALQKDAAAAYQNALKAAGGDQGARASAVPVFWKLDKLYQKMSQYVQALQLTEKQTAYWADNDLLDPRLKSELGALRAMRGQNADARSVLREAVAALEVQSPPNLVDLPRALTTLAGVEQATGELDRAEALASRCRELYRRYELPEDVVLVEVHNVEGTCANDRGRLAAAAERFSTGIELCRRLGSVADLAQANLLVNLILIHKSQAELEEAARRCREAKGVYARIPGADDLALGALDAATAALEYLRGDIAKAYALTPRLYEVCKKYELVSGPIPATALHCEALYHLYEEADFPAAERAWGRLREIQEKEKYALLLPRTLNYLAIAAELQGDLARAEELCTRARALQKDNSRAFPATHFITLWRLATYRERRGRKDEALVLLEEALGVVEKARLQTYGAGESRSLYFGQFLAGFERLIDLTLTGGDVETALAAITRSRSRVLLDQLQFASVDPRADLKGAQGEKLRRQEEEQRLRLNRLRLRAQLLPLEAYKDKGEALLAELDAAQEAYARTWRSILNANPLYRNLTADLAPSSFLPALHKALPPGSLLVVYCLGRQRSDLLLFGNGEVRAKVFPLMVPAEVAQRVGPAPLTTLETALNRRGLSRRKVPSPEPDNAPPGPPAGPMVPLTVEVARDLIDHYCLQVNDPDFRPTRGLALRARHKDRPLEPQKIEFLANVLLPEAARRRIQAAGAKTLIVVPDGPLHKLPLESLVLEAGPRPRYVLDDFPPIVYAPSAAVLTLLAERPPVRGPLSLLTVCNPAYPQANGAKVPKTLQNLLVALRGQLPLLPGTAMESKRIRALFDPKKVTVLEGAAATEGAVVEAVAGKRIIHLAAHGFADEHLGNLFGAIALTPPTAGKETAEEDGFLSLHEIYHLPLADCDLAVLSACETNVGPQQPLEAGVTLASGFLSAGARRVVASHWSVDDESTAALMEAFFGTVTAAANKGEPVDYARALCEARKKLRQQADTAAPFFWAPFVLLGAAD
jgi:CHAT domain-containing protein